MSTPAASFPERRRRWRNFGIATMLCVVCGTLHGLHARYGYLFIPRGTIDGNPAAAWQVVVWFIWRYGVWAALLPVMNAVVRRFPPGFDWRTNLRLVVVCILIAPVLCCVNLVLAVPIMHVPELAFPEPESLTETARTLLSSLIFQGLAICWVLFAGLALRAFQELERERERVATALRTQTMEANLLALQNQLQPHFLFNTLHALSSLIVRRPVEAVEMVERVSGFLRATLERGEAVQATLAEELTFLERYLAIEALRFSDRLRVEWAVDPAARDCLVPTLLLQPLAENAIRHGIARRAEPGTLRVVARLVADRLHIEVEDDGPGPLSAASTSGGLGLANTRARLAALFGEGEYALDLQAGPSGGAAVVLDLPVRRVVQGQPGPLPPSPTLEPAYA